MESKTAKVFCKILSWLNVCFCESFFGKGFEKIWNSLAKVFKSSLFNRFFSDDARLEDVWDESFLGKLLNLPKKFILFLQKKISPYINSSLSDSALFNTFSSWCTVSVRIYGVSLFVFSVCTTFLRENSKTALFILVFLEITSLLLVLINRSIKQLVSGSKIILSVGEIFSEYEEKETTVTRVKIHHYIIACLVGIALSLICTYSGLYTFLFIVGVVLAFAFLMKYLTLGVYMTVALAPVLPTMALVGLSFLCAFVFFIHMMKNPDLKFTKNSLNVCVVFFVIALIWGTFNSFAIKSSFKQVMVHASFILFYFVLTNVITTKKQWISLAKIFIFSALLVALYGIVQNFFGASSTDSWIDEEMFEDIKLRVYSFFNNPNVLGEFLVLTIPVSLALVFGKAKEFHKLLFTLCLLCMVLCMIFTWSRGAWLGMLLAVAIYLVVSDRRWLFTGVLLLFLVPVLLYATGNTAILERFISIGNTADTSTAYRVSIWQASLAIIKDFWLGGIGIGSDAYTTIYPSYALSGARFALHSHNLYLQLWVETGIIGIVLLISLLLGFIRTVFSTGIVSKMKTDNMAKIIVSLGCGFLGFMFQGLTDYVWYNYKILMIFWIVIALGVSGAKIIKENKGGNSL